ncbi:hypothetical protein FA95DRAFT_125057 [Auriscalpium vulgare]|uniref:Uncharacterized protein n=1 Tax=Auriscalpium vulgare TaxID=40419 RepID=A0ACB8RML0_9AGAM|nr:hypothetical protein FA95DRAFT_125057 [Auriscalpium vulgare]
MGERVLRRARSATPDAESEEKRARLEASIVWHWTRVLAAPGGPIADDPDATTHTDVDDQAIHGPLPLYAAGASVEAAEPEAEDARIKIEEELAQPEDQLEEPAHIPFVHRYTSGLFDNYPFTSATALRPGWTIAQRAEEVAQPEELAQGPFVSINSPYSSTSVVGQHRLWPTPGPPPPVLPPTPQSTGFAYQLSYHQVIEESLPYYPDAIFQPYAEQPEAPLFDAADMRFQLRELQLRLQETTRRWEAAEIARADAFSRFRDYI